MFMGQTRLRPSRGDEQLDKEDNVAWACPQQLGASDPVHEEHPAIATPGIGRVGNVSRRPLVCCSGTRARSARRPSRSGGLVRTSWLQAVTP